MNSEKVSLVRRDGTVREGVIVPPSVREVRALAEVDPQFRTWADNEFRYVEVVEIRYVRSEKDPTLFLEQEETVSE